MSKQKTTRRRSKVQTTTLREFKTWLDGYCSAQENGWTPSVEQWNLIKEKMFAIEEDDSPQYQMPPQYQQMQPMKHHAPQMNLAPMMPEPIPVNSQLSQPQAQIVDQRNAPRSKPALLATEDGKLRMPPSESGDPSSFI